MQSMKHLTSTVIAFVLFCPPSFGANYFWLQPNNTALKNVVIANDTPANNNGFYSYSFGGTLQMHSNWNVADFSGMQTSTPLAHYQASINPNWYGSTSVQLEGHHIAMHLHSYSLPHPSPMGWYFLGWHHPMNARPWRNDLFGSNPKLCIEHSEAVVGSHQENGAAFYNGMYLWLADKNGVSFQYSIKTWDNRWPNINITEDAFYDPGLNWYYIGTSYNENRKYLTLIPYSHTVTNTQGNNLRWYGICISKAQLAAAILDMNIKNQSNPSHILDSDTSSYTVSGITFNSEIGNLSTATHTGGAGWYTTRTAGIYAYTNY